MIVGEFEGTQPYVSAVVGIPRLGVFGTVRFLADTGASLTCIHPREGVPLRLPFDRLKCSEYVNGAGGRSERFVEHATLTFLDAVDTATYRYDLDVRIGKPEQVSRALPSVLGQDVLSRWVMVHDPAIGRLQFHVRSSDERLS